MVIREKHKNHGMASDTESDQIEKRRGGRRKMETLPSEEKRREESQNEADSEEHKRN